MPARRSKTIIVLNPDPEFPPEAINDFFARRDWCTWNLLLRGVTDLPGTGKHQGRLGALMLELPNGTRFKVGTGLSDEERELLTLAVGEGMLLATATCESSGSRAGPAS